jgi:hypothetical protein
MAGLIPETATRLEATAFVRDAELQAVGRSQIIRAAAVEMARQALDKLLRDCITTKGNYAGYQGQTLMLDVYVLEPYELHKMLAAARMLGEQDAIRSMTPNVQAQAAPTAATTVKER